MKKFASLILSLILTVALLASCTMEDMEYIGERVQEHIDEQTPTDPEPDPEPELSTYEKIVAVALPLDEHYTLERLNQKEIFSDFSKENIDQIMAGFDVIIDNNKTIRLPRTTFLHKLFSRENIGYSYSTDIIFVDTDIQREVLKYAMLASVYLQNFPENTFPLVPLDMRIYMNSIPPYDIIVSFDEEPKYKEVQGHYDANGNVIKARIVGNNDYRFSATSINITPPAGSSESENLLKDLKASLDYYKIALEKSKNKA